MTKSKVAYNASTNINALKEQVKSPNSFSATLAAFNLFYLGKRLHPGSGWYFVANANKQEIEAIYSNRIYKVLDVAYSRSGDLLPEHKAVFKQTREML